MAARGAKGDPQLEALVRERQDLVGEWEQRDALRIAAVAQPLDQRNAMAEAEALARLKEIADRIAEIDKRLQIDFPNYAALARPAPLSIADVQADLGTNEALVLFLDMGEGAPTPEETFIWVVTKTETRWVRSELGRESLTREVRALRCGLDAAAWNNGSNCAELTGQANASTPLLFDHARAHRLYEALFGKVAELIKGKQLLIVPSGALTQLPFQVLHTRHTESDDHRSAAWFIRDHAITILPAVSSLKALRRVSRPSAAIRPVIGFGNPLLDGEGYQDRLQARRARDNQRCVKIAWEKIGVLLGVRGGIAPLEMHGRLADVSEIRKQSPLPETADELCAVARDLDASLDDIRLGSRATEREVKELSKSGELAHYRIVHFATHGAMAGELSGAREPGLILTPPETASDADDGYLSGSEIAGLKLDADWVILSACNTAAGASANAEALSGLARAFIYARARALLVSHWAVYSDATVKLITTTIREIAKNENVGRAEGLRRAMLALIDRGDADEAHPSFWAPFIIVGEGAS